MAMDPGIGERFAASRSAWLDSARVRLERDQRVGAVLLAGSFGRKSSDDWSDLDLVVVLAPDSAFEVIAKRQEFARAFGNAVFVFDSPWNAPLDGAQVNALYDVDAEWPLYVDWDLWPLERGAIPPDVGVLFDRVGLPPTELGIDELRSWPRQSRPEPTPAHLQEARRAMLPIIAKCLVRGDVTRAHRMLANLGYAPASMASTDLLDTARSMWTDIAPGSSDHVARTVEQMLAVTAQAVAG